MTEAETIKRILTELEQEACTCDALIGFSCGIHNRFSKVQSAIASLTWEPVEFCHSIEVTLAEFPKSGKLYVVRGPEMFLLQLPPLPPKDPTKSSGRD